MDDFYLSCYFSDVFFFIKVYLNLVLWFRFVISVLFSLVVDVCVGGNVIYVSFVSRNSWVGNYVGVFEFER